MGKFILYPAIDLRHGSAVRLYQGDYGKEIIYGDPLEIARSFAISGAKGLHVVDLDGAKAGYPVQQELIRSILRQVEIPVQVGGGIRKLTEIAAYLEDGVFRVILGTKAVEDPDFIKAALQQFGDRIAIGIDAQGGTVRTRGWLQDGGVDALALAERLAEWGASTFIYTDISRDGTLTGVNLPAVVEFARRTKKEVIASGGISEIKDLLALQEYEREGVVGAIVGKALYSGSFTLQEALQRLEGGRAGAHETDYPLS